MMTGVIVAELVARGRWSIEAQQVLSATTEESIDVT